MDAGIEITQDDLERVFSLKYTQRWGWGPRYRNRFQYFSPDDQYEALLMRLVRDGCAWLDVGCGRGLFPSNDALAQRLAGRAGLLAGIDPDPGLSENAVIRQCFRVKLEDFQPDREFDLVTMRMVAEHVTDPDRFVAGVSRALKSGGHAVVYTVNRYSPVPLITRIVPFRFHRPIKRIVWIDTEPFPTAFRMNSRTRLKRLFARHGFSEMFFRRLDDCRALEKFRVGHLAELTLWKALHAVGIRYPEQCLLGVYRKQ